MLWLPQKAIRILCRAQIHSGGFVLGNSDVSGQFMEGPLPFFRTLVEQKVMTLPLAT